MLHLFYRLFLERLVNLKSLYLSFPLFSLTLIIYISHQCSLSYLLSYNMYFTKLLAKVLRFLFIWRIITFITIRVIVFIVVLWKRNSNLRYIPGYLLKSLILTIWLLPYLIDFWYLHDYLLSLLIVILCMFIVVQKCGWSGHHCLVHNTVLRVCRVQRAAICNLLHLRFLRALHQRGCIVSVRSSHEG